MSGSRIVVDADGKLVVPLRPIVPVVPGVGASAQATSAALREIDAAVSRAYGASRSVRWLRLEAGEASMQTVRTPVPDATVQAIRVHRVALIGALPATEGDARTLEAELVELLDLHLGICRAGTTLLCWENRESSATGLALEEGGSDAAIVQQALDEVAARAQAQATVPGFAVAVTSRHGTRRFTFAALNQRPGEAAAVLHDANEAPSFLRWVKEAARASNAEISTLTLSAALTLSLSARPLPRLVLSNRSLAERWLSVASALPHAPLSRELSHPDTGHALFLPLRDDLNPALLPSAMLDAANHLLRRLGWMEAADELQGAAVAKAS